MKKRLLSLVLALATCLSLCTTVFADPSVSIEGKKAYLRNVCNIPDSFLDSVEDETVEKIYEEAAGNSVTVASYNEVTENMEEPTQAISPMASIPASDFKMSTLVLKTTDSAGSKTLYYTVYTYYEWFDKDPFCRRRDGITVNWDNTLLTYMPGYFSLKSYLKNDVNPKWREYASDNVPDASNQGGVGVSFLLSADKGNWLKGTLSFRLVTDFSGSGRRTTINSQYAHTYDLIIASIGFNADGPGINFSTTTKRKLCSSSAMITL